MSPRRHSKVWEYFIVSWLFSRWASRHCWLRGKIIINRMVIYRHSLTTGRHVSTNFHPGLIHNRMLLTLIHWKLAQKDMQFRKLEVVLHFIRLCLDFPDDFKNIVSWDEYQILEWFRSWSEIWLCYFWNSTSFRVCLARELKIRPRDRQIDRKIDWQTATQTVQHRASWNVTHYAPFQWQMLRTKT